LIEDNWSARVVAAYIDLNPVRAGLVEDPADWPWSGYAEAAMETGPHADLARAGLCRAWHAGEAARGVQTPLPWQAPGGGVAEAYRTFLLTRDDPAAKAGIPPAPAERPAPPTATNARPSRQRRQQPPKLSPGALLRGRVAHFHAGLAIGSRPFLDAVFQASRPWFGPRRSSGPRRLRRSAVPLFALRDLDHP
jgi:hypothetical protein